MKAQRLGGAGTDGAHHGLNLQPDWAVAPRSLPRCQRGTEEKRELNPSDLHRAVPGDRCRRRHHECTDPRSRPHGHRLQRQHRSDTSLHQCRGRIAGQSAIGLAGWVSGDIHIRHAGQHHTFEREPTGGGGCGPPRQTTPRTPAPSPFQSIAWRSRHRTQLLPARLPLVPTRS